MGHGNLLTSRNHVKLVRLSEFFPIKSSTSGEGIGGILHRILTGANNSNLKDNEYFKGSLIQCTAIPENGSFFKRWHGDLESTQNPCVVTVDAAKSITAEFDFITYPITLKIIGSGMGAITPSIQADAYPHGTVLALTATATADSRLKQWSGDASGTNPDTTLTIDGSKSVTVEFVQIYPLCTSTTGQGQGMVQRSVQADAYDVDSVVQLTAIPTEGHLFVGWQGDASGKQPTCSVHMDSAKVVSAEFVSKPSFNVDVACVGTGSGVVLPAIQTHYQGSVVGLVAKAEIGSIFDGWEGSVSGFEPRCSVTVNADLEITARFSRIEIPETDISVVFDGVDSYTSTGGYEATVLLFNVSNQSERQIRIDVPLADYVTLHGEEVTQLAWQKGMINGGQGSTLRSGAFRKMGLVFDQRRLPTLQAGEHLHLTLQQSKPALQLHMSFRCTDSVSRDFSLVKVSMEKMAEAPAEEATAEPVAAAAWTSRMQQMEQEMQEALSKLNAAAAAIAAAPPPPPPAPPPTATPLIAGQTLFEVLAWLCTQNRVPVALLRQKLLPLDLMPSAVIDDINERAFDVAGEAALDEAEDTVTVQRGVLLQVLAAW